MERFNILEAGVGYIRLSVAFILFSTGASIAQATGDISFEASTTQLINRDWKLNDRPSHHKWRGVMGERGLMAEGQPTVIWNTYERTNNGAGSWSSSGAKRINDGFIIEYTDSHGSFLRQTIRFQGSRCIYSAESNFSSIAGTCRIISRGPSRQAPDNPQACRVVMDTKTEIEALLNKESKESCATSEKIKKLSKSIRGANCASKMLEIDQVLKRHEPMACWNEYYQRHGIPSPVGRRG